jgi:predicted TIM-barrel fold metal-dependent hydrolase
MTLIDIKNSIPDLPLNRVPSIMAAKVQSRQVFFDVHTHVFTKADVPNKYLGIRLPFTDRFLGTIGKLLHTLNRKTDDDKMSRLAYFIQIINSKSSQEIYQLIEKYYTPESIFGVLMMDMSIGIEGKHDRDLVGQMDALKDLRDAQPTKILPFVAIDPRRPNALAIFSKAFSQHDDYKFFGLKVYPSLGYLPSHPVLMQMLDMCEAKKIPVLSHCSGATVHSSHRWIKKIEGTKFNADGSECTDPINKLFLGKKAYGGFFNSPRNWEPVLRTFPKLKLNLAHFGGGDQWEDFLAGKNDTWVARIIDQLYRYPNVYTDFAYTLTDHRFAARLKQMMQDNQLIAERALFGSDYYMLVREGHYRNLLASFRTIMGDSLMQKMAVDNPLKHLFDQ